MKVIVYVLLMISGQAIGPYFDTREECEAFKARGPMKNEAICTRIAVIPPAIAVRP